MLAESTVDHSCIFVFICHVMAVIFCPYRRSTFHPRKENPFNYMYCIFVVG